MYMYMHVHVHVHVCSIVCAGCESGSGIVCLAGWRWGDLLLRMSSACIVYGEPTVQLISLRHVVYMCSTCD